jgi:anti-anti-sigma factor
MTLSSFSNLASGSNSIAAVAVNSELVRGSETQVMVELLPRVRRESVALNLSGVNRIDAAGIAALITLYCTSMQAGNYFSVVAPSPHVLEMLRVVGLDGVLVTGRRPHVLSGCCVDRPAA